MARQATRRIPTPGAAQGEDAWVEMRRPTRGQAQQVRSLSGGGTVEMAALLQEAKQSEGDPGALRRVAQESETMALRTRAGIDQVLVEVLVGWNWEDEAGEPLPLPATPEALDELTAEEAAALDQALLELCGIREASAPPTEQEKN